jgi:hypothetical protein
LTKRKDPKDKKKMGRPSRKDEINYKGLKLLAERGFIDDEYAMCLSIEQSTFDRWKQRDPEFFSSLKDFKEVADRSVKKSLYERACGWTDPDGKTYPPDVTACIFWLKNRQPDKWRDKREVDVYSENTLTIKLSGSERAKVEKIAQEVAKKITEAGGIGE